MSNITPAYTTTNQLQRYAVRLCIWAGIMIPFLFVLIFSLAGFLKPTYLAQPISYLELGANGWLQRTNFIILGLFLILFTVGLSQRMNSLIKRMPLRVSTGLLLLVGLAFVNDGVFTPAAPGEIQNVVHAVLHGVGFEVIFFSLPIACLIIGWQLRKRASWRTYGWYSLMTGCITVIPALFVVVSSFTPASSGTQSPSFVGLINRIFVVEALAWYVITGIRLLTFAKRNS